MDPEEVGNWRLLMRLALPLICLGLLLFAVGAITFAT